MNVKVKKIHPDAIIPHIAHEGDAGCDLFATESMTLNPGERGQVPTGLALEIPIGYVGLIWDKSGVSHKGGIKTLGGVIDSGYRGEIQIGVINLSSEAYTFEKGHKVAQLLIQKVETPIFEEVIELSDTSRGEGAFGSTGVRHPFL
jgi:dUTP pyrophosphatase